MSNQELINLQETGFSKEHSTAQKAIIAARSKTPEQYRDLFRSYYYFVPEDKGYEWGWVLK